MKVKYIITLISFFTCMNLVSQNAALNITDDKGLKQGYWQEYKEIEGKNILTSEGKYINNLKTGEWREYYSTGKIKNSFEYKDGRITGNIVTFDENGYVSESGTWINKRFVGSYITFYPSSIQPKHNFYFTDSGKREGWQAYYDKNGKLVCEEFYVDGKLNNRVCNNTNEKIYQKDTVRRHQITYFASGKVYSDVEYKNELRDGTCVLYYENGIVKFKAEYKVDKMFGERSYYDENGKPINGEFVMYDRNNVKDRSGTCINGKPEGELKLYLSNGAIYKTYTFKDGKVNGPTYDHMSGKPVLEERYANGVFVEKIVAEEIK